MSAGSTRPGDGDFEILRIDDHVDFLGLGQHGNRNCRCVNAPAGFGDGHAFHALNAAFKFQLFVNIRPGDEKNRFTVTATFGVARAHRLDFPTLRIGVAVINARQFCGEKRRFLATRAGANFHNGVSRIRRLRRDHRQ